MDHASIEITMDIYAEVTEMTKKEALDNLSANLDIFKHWKVRLRKEFVIVFLQSTAENGKYSICTVNLIFYLLHNTAAAIHILTMKSLDK